MVYDINNKKNFEKLNEWRNEFLSKVGTTGTKNFPFIVLGNKCDLVDSREVSTEKARAWAAKIGAEFLETSAKDMIGIDESFIKSVDLIVEKHKDAVKKFEDKEKHSLKLIDINKKKGSCC